MYNADSSYFTEQPFIAHSRQRPSEVKKRRKKKKEKKESADKQPHHARQSISTVAGYSASRRNSQGKNNQEVRIDRATDWKARREKEREEQVPEVSREIIPPISGLLTGRKSR